MTLPTRAEIQTWMSSNRKGKNDACEHFGITKRELWNVLNASRAGAGRGARVSAPERLGPLAWRNAKLDQIEEVINAAVTAERVNAVGIAALMKSAMKLRGEIDHLDALKPKNLDDATPEEVHAYLELHMDAWPDMHLEQAMQLYATRHGGRVWFISDGGHRAELDGDEGWRVVNE